MHTTVRQNAAKPELLEASQTKDVVIHSYRTNPGGPCTSQIEATAYKYHSRVVHS